MAKSRKKSRSSDEIVDTGSIDQEYDEHGPVPPGQIVQAASSFPGGTSTEAICWVAEYAYVPWSQIRVEDIPCKQAYNLMVMFRKGLEFEKLFWQTHFSKTIASQTEIEQHQRRTDDGRKQLQIIDDLTKETADVDP